MIYRQLGKSALKVSALCLGTMNFGPRTSEDESRQIMSAALELGINFFDTANQYGGDKGVGASEEIIGRWFRESPSRRDGIVLATKVYEPMSPDINDRGLSARHIQTACEASLRRLGVDHIDLYQMHHIDRLAPPEEIWQAMDRLISQGKITYVGSSNFPGWKLAQMNERAGARHSLGLVSEQGLYNLLERRTELEVLPACREYGIGLIAWSPLAGGLLAGRAGGAAGRRSSESARTAARAHQNALDLFERLCSEACLAPGLVALSWLLSQEGLTSAIIGPGTKDQLISVLQAPEIRLDPDLLVQLDAIFPPCGPSPEAYAW
ncbi:MAG: aldo/keto reductase [Alphaproteobacteria bacterium]|nr:aldo/keto reductase [Alphaproteobacteria bacterium]